MPSWTLGDLLSSATKRIGRRADIDKSDASLFVNQAYHDVQERADFALSERIAVSSTTSGENKIDCPADMNELIALSNLSSNQTLRRMSVEDIDNTDVDSLGEPTEYALYRDWIELGPSPDSAYSLQLRYKSFATDLVNDSDIPSVSTPWRFPILLKAEEYLLELTGDSAGAASKRNQYLSAVRSLDDDEAKRQKASRHNFALRTYSYSPDD